MTPPQRSDEPQDREPHRRAPWAGLAGAPLNLLIALVCATAIAAIGSSSWNTSHPAAPPCASQPRTCPFSPETSGTSRLG